MKEILKDNYNVIDLVRKTFLILSYDLFFFIIIFILYNLSSISIMVVMDLAISKLQSPEAIFLLLGVYSILSTLFLFLITIKVHNLINYENMIIVKELTNEKKSKLILTFIILTILYVIVDLIKKQTKFYPLLSIMGLLFIFTIPITIFSKHWGIKAIIRSCRIALVNLHKIIPGLLIIIAGIIVIMIPIKTISGLPDNVTQYIAKVLLKTTSFFIYTFIILLYINYERHMFNPDYTKQEITVKKMLKQ